MLITIDMFQLAKVFRNYFWNWVNCAKCIWNVVYKKSGYQNDWNGNDVSEGTYFFILKNFDKSETYSGFFQIEK